MQGVEVCHIYHRLIELQTLHVLERRRRRRRRRMAAEQAVVE